METIDLKEHFQSLYNYIIQSDDKDKMHVLGEVTKAMMMHAIETNPKQAAEWIDKMESIKWHNYLTEHEAEAIVEKMKPKPLWSRSTWEEAMMARELPLCEEPYYNTCALYVTMSMITSDSLTSLKKHVQANGEDKIFDAVYDFAMDKLMDEDKNFDIRKYFNLK